MAAGIVVTGVSVLVGGSLAGATLIGLVNSQTDAPSESPGDSVSPALVYGTTE